MLWHKQVIFKLKGDKLSFSAECRIWTWEVWDTNSPADWMSTHKPTEISGIKLKTLIRYPVPMMSEYSAHLTSLQVGFHTWHCQYTSLLLSISMLWHRQAIFESKGNKLSSSVFLCWMQDSNLEVSRHLFPSRLNAHSQTDWAIKDQAKNLELAIYMFAVVNFDALAQASDFLIKRRQVVPPSLFL